MSRSREPAGGRIVLLLFVAALVALAGCGGASPADGDGSGGTPAGTVTAPDTTGDSGDDATRGSPTPTATPSPTPTATPSPTPTATPEPTEAEGPGAFGTYAGNLRDAGSYTVAYRIDPSANASGTLVGTVRVNLDRETLNQTLRIESDDDGGSFDYYRPPGADVLYTRLRSGGRTAYQKQNVSETELTVFSDPVDAVRRESAEGMPDFRDIGTVTTAEGPRRQFVVDSVDGLPASMREEYAEIRSVSWVVLVDEDRGYVTDVGYELTFVRDEGGDPRTVTFELAYREIGSTTVEAPGWFEEAKERTDE